MRPVTLTDLAATARVLLAQPETRRAAALAALVARAAVADEHRRATGCNHPAYGNGTLLAAALAHPRAEPQTPGSTEYLTCLAQVIEGLVRGSRTS